MYVMLVEVQSALFHEDGSEERGEGLLPVTEDWHARMTLMKVSLEVLPWL